MKCVQSQLLFELKMCLVKQLHLSNRKEGKGDSQGCVRGVTAVATHPCSCGETLEQPSNRMFELHSQNMEFMEEGHWGELHSDTAQIFQMY